MRLDTVSMDKLWDLMTMLYKWQMFVAKSSNEVLDITLRHLDGIEKMLPDPNKSKVIDNARAVVVAFWNNLIDLDRIEIRNRIIKWLRPFNMKISVLLRLGLQKSDATFESNFDRDSLKTYVRNIGENIYVKSSGVVSKSATLYDGRAVENKRGPMQLESLVNQLNIQSTRCDRGTIDVTELFLNETRAIRRNDNVGNSKTEYISIDSSASKVDELLDKLNFSNDGNNSNDEIDVTGELLALLDGGDDK